MDSILLKLCKELSIIERQQTVLQRGFDPLAEIIANSPEWSSSLG